MISITVRRVSFSTFKAPDSPQPSPRSCLLMMANYDNYYCSGTPLTFRVCLVDGHPSCYLHGHPHGIAFPNLRPDAWAGGTRWLSRFGPLLPRFPAGFVFGGCQLRCELLEVGKEVTTENPGRFEETETTTTTTKSKWRRNVVWVGGIRVRRLL